MGLERSGADRHRDRDRPEDRVGREGWLDTKQKGEGRIFGELEREERRKQGRRRGRWEVQKQERSRSEQE